MPAATSRLALPYPIPDDSVDVPRDVQALATKLDALQGYGPPTFVTGALPAGSTSGDEVYYTPPGTSGIMWHLLWGAVTARWFCVGGPPLIAVDSNSETRGPTGAPYPAFFALNPASQILVPATGVYDVSMEAMWYSNTVNKLDWRMRAMVDGSTIAGTVDTILTSVAVNEWRQWVSESRLNLVGGTTIQLWAALSQTNSAVRIERKQLRIKPVYLV
jgi:hypothetical protein